MKQYNQRGQSRKVRRVSDPVRRPTADELCPDDGLQQQCKFLLSHMADLEVGALCIHPTPLLLPFFVLSGPTAFFFSCAA